LCRFSCRANGPGRWQAGWCALCLFAVAARAFAARLPVSPRGTGACALRRERAGGRVCLPGGVRVPGVRHRSDTHHSPVASTAAGSEGAHCDAAPTQRGAKQNPAVKRRSACWPAQHTPRAAVEVHAACFGRRVRCRARVSAGLPGLQGCLVGPAGWATVGICPTVMSRSTGGNPIGTQRLGRLLGTRSRHTGRINITVRTSACSATRTSAQASGRVERVGLGVL